MRVIKSENIEESGFTAVTLGNFDGVHLGHKELINSVKKYAEMYSLKSIVFSFFPHPKAVFGAEIFYTIFSPYEKEKVIEGFGVNELVQYPFSKKFAAMKPEEFARFIFDDIKCRVLIVGEDYCFGKDRRGNFDLLKAIGNKKGAVVVKISSVKYKGVRVSSTRIKECIKDRNFGEVSKLLDKPYFIIGTVLQGKKIGGKIDFPTANIIPPKDKLLPPDGVYLTKTLYDDNSYYSITNIGKNPTVGGTERTVETFIFDFDQELYNKEIIVCFYGFIREEYKFSSLDELKNQIETDKNKAIKVFKKLQL